MANHNLTSGVVTDAYPVKGLTRVFVQERELDCTVTPLVSGDTYDLFNIPAGTLVLCAAYRVVTVEGAADTFDWGDADSAARFYNDASANSTGYVGTYVTPLFYTADRTARLLANAALTAAKIRFYLVCVDCSFN